LLGLVAALVLGVSSAAGDAGSAVIVLPPDCVALGAGQDCSDAVTPFTVETAGGAALSSVPDAPGTIPWTFAAAANGSIVYSEAVGAQPWSPTGPVWLVRPGAAPLELDSSSHDFDPAISYDGSKVTFARENPATDASDIYTTNADGSGLQLIASGDGVDHLSLPKFSPDGGSIAYACYPAINGLGTGVGCGPTAVGMHFDSGLMLMNSDGSGKRMIVVGELYPFKWLAWSPDGSQLAVTGCLTVTVDDTISCDHDQVFRYRTNGSDLFNVGLAANQITDESGPTYLDGLLYAQFTDEGAQSLS